MRTASNTAAIAERPEDRALVAALAKRRLRELDRLRDLGFQKIEQLNAAADSMPRAVLFERMLGARGQVMEFERLARAIRQVVVLEFEIRGLFEAPNRDQRRLRLVKSDREGFEPPDREDLFADLREFDRAELDGPRPDYRTGPLDEVVAGIRKVLGAEPPKDDPFAPPPKPQTEKAAPPVELRPAKLPPASVKLPEKPVASPKPAPTQKALAVKAAVRVIKATGGHGFRIPSKKAQAKHRQGRAPP
ncbi:MAG TPA: hypothetical protein VH722_17260 [Alphaproteobacteria bacterium]|jgi:hypothetical protein|nr:hypothetical protein [Alphaproteobacteria bacterium]